MLHSCRLLSNNYRTAVNPIIGRNLTLAKKKKKKQTTLTSELRVPVTQGLLLGRSEVRKVIVLILQCFLIQAKGGKASGCISSSKDSIRPLFKNKTKPKTNCLLDSQFLCGSHTGNGFLTNEHGEPIFEY